MGVVSLGPSIRRRAFFALLYFSEGAPIGYVWWAMPTRLRQAGMPVEEVGALIALLTLPWALKFLWAPAIDRLRGPRWGYRAWITAAQLAMGAAILPLGLIDSVALTHWAALLLLAHAVAAATQDVAIDALAIATIPEAERARTTGWMQAGMLVGRALFGGLALSLEAVVGAEIIIFALVGCIWVTLLMLWLTPSRALGMHPPSATASEPLSAALRRLATRRSTWLGLGVALTAGAGFEAVGGLIGPMLIDRGATQEAIGAFFALPVVALMVLGGLAGGVAADRFGHLRLVVSSVLLIAACVLTLAGAQSLSGATPQMLMIVAAPMYLFIGSLTAASYALFMDLTDTAIGGTQFSLYMSATNACEVWAVAAAGALVGLSGYGLGFTLPAVASLLAILCALALRSRSPGPAPVTRT